MSKENHPSVQRYRERSSAPALSPLETEELRRICLESGADDVGFLSIDDPEIAVHKPDIIKLFPDTRTVVCLAVCPAGDDVISPFLENATAYVDRYVPSLSVPAKA